MNNRITPYLFSQMQKRRALIRTARGFKSGACDRADPVLRDVARLDLYIASVAQTEGFTEAEAWKQFCAIDDTPEREALRDLMNLIKSRYPVGDIAFVRSMQEAERVLNDMEPAPRAAG